MKKTVLLVCRDYTGFDLLSQIAHDVESRYIVASDDPFVQEACRRLDFVSEVCWLEQMESMYPVAADVLALLETINCWLKRCGDDHCINIFHVQQATVIVKALNAGREFHCFITMSRINIRDRY